jgi:hypothetical protein
MVPSRAQSSPLRSSMAVGEGTDLLASCAGFRISQDENSVPALTRLALREVAQRILHLNEQLTL